MQIIKVSVIIVSWNTRGLLRQCLNSLAATVGDLACEVIVVDNGSTDGSVKMVKEEFSEVNLIANDTNRGFGPANNQGIQIARGRYIVLLNSDTIVLPSALQSMLVFMDSQARIGAAGGLLLMADGQVQPSVGRFPRILEAMRIHLGMRSLPHQKACYYESQHLDLEYVSGAFIVLRRTVLDKVGLFDEQFFIYAEEQDLCLRIREAGFNIGYNPEARIIHFGGKSCQQHARSVYRLVSRLRFLRKHKGLLYFTTYRIFSMVSIIYSLGQGQLERKLGKRLLRSAITLSYDD